MIIGLGIDAADVNRFSGLHETSPLIRRCFTEAERAFFAGRKFAPETIAGTFAAKEALAKAAGTGIGRLGLQNIEVLREASGKPYIRTTGTAAETLASLQVTRIHISITHDAGIALAEVILEG